MFIDRILSRFTIRAKVLFFVLPFVLFISAVGLIGLYASGLLQQRMEMSNGTMRLLTGFRDVNSEMDRFLSLPTEETRNAAGSRLADQQQALRLTLDHLASDAVGVANLQAAMKVTASVASDIDGLWDLRQQEVQTDKAIGDNLTALMPAQMSLQEEAERLQRAVRGAESEAKTALRTADRMTSGSRFLNALVNEAATESAPERQFALLADRMGDLVKTQRKLASALTGDQAPLAGTLADAIRTLRERAVSSDTGLDAIAGVNDALSQLRRLARVFDDIADAKTAESVERFATVDAELVAAEEVLAGSRNLISGVYDLRILAATFRVTRDEESRERLLRQAGLIASNLETLGTSMKNRTFHEDLAGRIMPALAALEANSAHLVEQDTVRRDRFAEVSSRIAAGWTELTTFADLQKDVAGAERGRANGVSIAATALGVLLAIAGGLALVVTLQRPIAGITATMGRLADGDLDTSIAGEGRGDEIGAMARALGIFKNNARQKLEIEADGLREREAVEAERRRNDDERKRVDAEIDHAVGQLAAALERLAAGDISFEIEERFAGRLERLRSDFNLSLARLRDTMGQIAGNVGAIRDNGRQMAQSSAELSRRTEQQAASLEETAAAVDEITQTVKTAAERAREANLLVTETKRDADDSSVVVGNAVSAMGRIETASQKIEQIIDVIDDIAFQTNLLALNAGVEAARAGEQGKGFAVVAQEVRELAQRSGRAAQEIKSLINSSTQEVSTGATHVKQAGAVLDRISRQITTISQHVELIATASREQSTALQEVNSAVNQMDQMTQQNAAMVEEATAASHDLAGEADVLMQLVGRFRIEERRTGAASRSAA